MRKLGLPKNSRGFLPLIAAGAALAASVVAVPAMAGSRGYYERYDDSRYERSADYSRDYRRDNSRTDYAQVISARPIYREVQVSQPRRECYDQRVTYREPRYAGNNAAGAILGGIIGGVAGHQFGGGHGQDVATAVGAVVGASVGSQAGQYNRGGATRTGYETRCDTVDDVRYESRIEGYDVTYRYEGQIYQTTMPYDPGNRIPVNVDVRPVRY